MTESRLEDAAITAADVPGLRADTAHDSTGIMTRTLTASSGGPACTEFLNASNASADTYHPSSELGRAFITHTAAGTMKIRVSWVGHASPTDAQRVINDTRSSAKGCPRLTDEDGQQRMSLAPLSQPVMGDDSTVVRVGLISGRLSECATVGLVRVGTVSLTVTVFAHDGYYPQILQEVAKASVSKLQKAQRST
ncbi:hypothetical protein ACFYZB_13575 [Streptomyces sp. NPDC001852]|uniref:hypothetical protein n=1 Tax=Streptomyces sp. NPDC001852 TaxID=3364619 RepID=UPI0036A0D4EC